MISSSINQTTIRSNQNYTQNLSPTSGKVHRQSAMSYGPKLTLINQSRISGGDDKNIGDNNKMSK
jgi:hypothetical protein